MEINQSKLTLAGQKLYSRADVKPKQSVTLISYHCLPSKTYFQKPTDPKLFMGKVIFIWTFSDSSSLEVL